MHYTQRSRKVLDDVKLVRQILEHEKGRVEWRLQWITAVVLIRAVGHVLAKVDGATNPLVREVSNKLHKKWMKPEEDRTIFKDFIEEERNSILKEYEFGMSEGPVPIALTIKNPSTGELAEQQAFISENIYRPMWSGPYEGEDGRTLLDEAITWWEEQLSIVDREVASRTPAKG